MSSQGWKALVRGIGGEWQMEDIREDFLEEADLPGILRDLAMVVRNLGFAVRDLVSNRSSLHFHPCNQG